MSINQTEQSPAQARLDAMRAEATALQSSGATSSAPTVQVGDVVHATATGLTIPRTANLWGGRPALSLTKGDEFTVDVEMLAADIDRHGNPGWSAIVSDPAAQVVKWGRQYLAPGPAPAGMPQWDYGDATWREQREQARSAAWAETDPKRRAAALQAVTDTYGAAPTTSTVHATYKGDRAFEEQRQRIEAAAAAGVPNLGPSRGGE